MKPMWVNRTQGVFPTSSIYDRPGSPAPEDVMDVFRAEYQRLQDAYAQSQAQEEARMEEVAAAMRARAGLSQPIMGQVQVDPRKALGGAVMAGLARLAGARDKFVQPALGGFIQGEELKARQAVEQQFLKEQGAYSQRVGQITADAGIADLALRNQQAQTARIGNQATGVLGQIGDIETGREATRRAKVVQTALDTRNQRDNATRLTVAEIKDATDRLRINIDTLLPGIKEDAKVKAATITLYESLLELGESPENALKAVTAKAQRDLAAARASDSQVGVNTARAKLYDAMAKWVGPKAISEMQRNDATAGQAADDLTWDQIKTQLEGLDKELSDLRGGLKSARDRRAEIVKQLALDPESKILLDEKSAIDSDIKAIQAKISENGVRRARIMPSPSPVSPNAPFDPMKGKVVGGTAPTITGPINGR
jgi:hypothetical protein